MKIVTRNGTDLTGKTFRRAFNVRAAAVDTEKRTVELAFSSEEPARQYFGTEILSHKPGAVDISRLNDGAPLLWMHNMDRQIGVVESARIDSDATGRALVRFSKSTEGEENFRDVQDGIKTKVSVGYQILGMVLESTDSTTGEEVYRVTKWMPYEISLVSVPADNTVGVGRSATVDTVAEQPSKPAAVIQESRKMTKEQIEAIRSLANKNASRVKAGVNLLDEAVRFISEEKTPADFQSFILDNLAERSQDAGSIEVKTGGLASREVFRSAIKDVVAAKGARSLKLGYGKRTFDGAATAGGEMIGLQMQETVPVLRNKSVLLGLGAKLLTGATSNIRYPRITGAAAAAWKAKGAAAGGTAPVTGSVELAPKRLTITFNVDKALLAQVTDMESILENEINAALGLGLDLAGIAGTGDEDDQPQGIIGTAGVGEVTFAAGGIAWDKTCEFLGKVETANYDAASCGWFIDPTVMAKAMSTQKANGLGFILENKQIAGYATKISNQVPAGRVVFGDAAQTVFALFGDGYDLTMDPYTRAGYGEIVLTAQVLADFAVLQPKAFVVSTNSGVSNA